MKEIGSEFYQQYGFSETEKPQNEINLLSGRTALCFIIEDIRRTGPVKKALLPSYCCETMIFPFAHAGIDIEFYDSDNEKTDYPEDNDADIVLLIDFFGYVIRENSEIARKAREKGKVVIYDSTHKIDGNPETEKYADYSFCSYRKWFYCNFAKLVKHNGEFDNDSVLKQNERYVKLRDKAAEEKKKYLEGFSEDKEVFLSDFGKAEDILDNDYAGYMGRPLAFDMSDIVSKRRENAVYLMKELKKIPQITLWKDAVGEKDTPMFVPILVEPAVRNELRKMLVSEKIYCPVHWPKSDYHKKCGYVYDRELSIVCDQRYGTDDMERIVLVIKKFFDR